MYVTNEFAFSGWCRHTETLYIWRYFYFPYSSVNVLTFQVSLCFIQEHEEKLWRSVLLYVLLTRKSCTFWATRPLRTTDWTVHATEQGGQRLDGIIGRYRLYVIRCKSYTYRVIRYPWWYDDSPTASLSHWGRGGGHKTFPVAVRVCVCVCVCLFAPLNELKM